MIYKNSILVCAGCGEVIRTCESGTTENTMNQLRNGVDICSVKLDAEELLNLVNNESIEKMRCDCGKKYKIELQSYEDHGNIVSKSTIIKELKKLTH
jgi:hypothetical protein